MTDQERPTRRAGVSPRSRRKRRQQVQQTRCCACLVVLVAAVALSVVMIGRVSAWRAERQARLEAARAYHFPLELAVEGERFLRYQRVPIVMRLQDAEGEPVVTEDPPAVLVQHKGETVVTVGNVQKLTPRYRKQSGDYLCYWPVPWGAEPGEYTATARLKIEDPAAWKWAEPPGSGRQVGPGRKEPPAPEGPSWCTAQVRFEVAARPPAEFPVGTAVATWEADFPTGEVPLPRGGRGDWRAMMEWARFMGADTVVFRGAVTATHRGALSAEQPFVAHNLTAIPRLAEEAKRQGLKFGVYAIAYETLPYESSKGKPEYQWAQDISRSTGRVSDHHFISLLDQRRLQDLVRFLRQMEAEPNVDLVGLDYIRSDTGGYEMTEAFTSQMPVPLPKNWGEMTEKQQWLHVANKVEKEFQTAAGAGFYDQWNWWRAHLVAGNVEKMLRESGLKKPSFVFMLSWMHGMQHGQDSAMFTDAGITVLMPMLYQMPSQEHFEHTMRQWNAYMRPEWGNLAPGNQVDDFWHQRSRNPAAPELLYQRMTESYARMVKDGRAVGTFWHDLSRAALTGTRGPYPGTEWALAGAAAFSELRQAWGVYPLRFELKGPDRVMIGVPFTMRVVVENVSRQTVRNVRMSVESTPQVKATEQARVTLPAIGPGVKVEQPLQVVVGEARADRANRFMVAVRAEWPERDYGRQFRQDLPEMYVLMKYVQARSPGGN